MCRPPSVWAPRKRSRVPSSPASGAAAAMMSLSVASLSTCVGGRGGGGDVLVGAAGQVGKHRPAMQAQHAHLHAVGGGPLAAVVVQDGDLRGAKEKKETAQFS